MRNNITACPSPLGTNRERLYLVRRRGPAMALDQEMDDPEGYTEDYDIADKVRELLVGKLDDADIEALIELMNGSAARSAPQSIATDARLRRHVSTSLARRAQTTAADLERRFPALKGSRVIG